MFMQRKIAIQCLWCKAWLKIDLKNGKSLSDQAMKSEDSKETAKTEWATISALVETPLFLVSCPKCKQLHRLRIEAAGETMRCLNCEATIQIPSLTDQPTVVANNGDTEIGDDEDT